MRRRCSGLRPLPGPGAHLLHSAAWERNVIGLRLHHVAANEAVETVGTFVAFEAAPYRIPTGCDGDQLLDMLAPAAIIVGDEQQALPFRPNVRVIQQSQARNMDAATLREVNVRLAVDTRKPLAFDVVANLVKRQAQALLAARLNPGDYDESVRGNGTSLPASLYSLLLCECAGLSKYRRN